MKGALLHAAAAFTAVQQSFAHARQLAIRWHEWPRYYLKSVNLALCYFGFARKGDFKGARCAGRAAFFCCAYDVVTDWRNFDRSALHVFEKLVTQELPENLAELAIALLRQEQEGALTQDGLSRGVDALRFICRLVGSEEHIRTRLDFENLGLVMQIVDDVLDWEEDWRTQQLNCLASSSRENHLNRLVQFDLGQFTNLFPHATVLAHVVRTAQRKARLFLLNPTVALFAGFPAGQKRPSQEIENKERCEVF